MSLEHVGNPKKAYKKFPELKKNSILEFGLKNILKTRSNGLWPSSGG